uniref:Uncharacterized protein n=1 Tax=Arundo donax TaxID=35708 RepID=A0A0A9FZI0_ARUDO
MESYIMSLVPWGKQRSICDGLKRRINWLCNRKDNSLIYMLHILNKRISKKYYFIMCNLCFGNNMYHEQQNSSLESLVKYNT